MELALRGILIGLSLGAPVGPINVEIVRRGLRSGFLSGWLVGAGAITGDALYSILVIAGVTPLVSHQAVQTTLWILGALFLIFLAYSSLRTALTRRELLAAEGQRIERRSYLTGLLMALFNPMGILFWLSIGGAAVASGVEHADAFGTVAMVVGIILGLGLWVTTLSTIVQAGRRFVSDRLFRAINIGSAVLLLGFGVWFGVQATRAIL